jgi:hypothetical protein
MGLVSKTSTGWVVQEVGFAAPQIAVTETDGVLTCECLEKQPCVHLEAIKEHVRLGKSVEVVGVERQSEPEGSGTPPTPKQLALIRVRCAEIGLNADAICQEWNGCDVSQLQGTAIRAFIDRLQNL